MRRLGLLILATLLAPLPALAQNRPVDPPPAQPTDPDDSKTKKTIDDAKDVASQPVKDVGVDKTKIPPSLEAAAADPYSLAGLNTCAKIANAVRVLNAALGPDYNAGGPNDKTSTGKAVGSAVVNSLVPFRGLVREASGAAAADRRYAVAVQAGFARRGFLRGVSQTRGCTDAM